VALCKFKKNKVWIWKAYDRHNNRLIGWLCGDRSCKTLALFLKRLKEKKSFSIVQITLAYRSLIPPERLYGVKDKTHTIERNNCLQRHWLAQVKLISIVVSKSIEMIDLSIGLFAAFHINKIPSFTKLLIY